MEQAASLQEYIDKYDLQDVLGPKMFQSMKIVKLDKYEPLIAINSIPSYLYFLVEGEIRCAHYQGSGVLAVVESMHPLSLLGDVELVSKKQTITAATAMIPSVVLTIPIKVVEDEGMNDPSFLRYLCRALVEKLNLSTSLRLGHLLPVQSRLALYILSLAESTVKPVVVLPEKEVLASMLGTSYRHLNRVLKDFYQKKLIGTGYPGVRILDYEKLQQLADE